MALVIWINYEDSLPFESNLYRLKGFIFLYIFCSVFSLYCFGFTGIEISDNCLRKYALTPDSGYAAIIMNNFVQYDKFHLFMNMMMLAALSFIEIRIGTLFFLCAFLIPSFVLSAVFTQFIPGKSYMLGSSVGIAGLIGVLTASYMRLPAAVVRKSRYAGILNSILGFLIVSVVFLLTKRPRYLNLYSYLAHTSGAVMTYVSVLLFRRLRD